MIVLVLIIVDTTVVCFLPGFAGGVPDNLITVMIITVVGFKFVLGAGAVNSVTDVSSNLPDFRVPVIPLAFRSLTVILPCTVLVTTINLVRALLAIGMISRVAGAHKHTGHRDVNRNITGLFYKLFRKVNNYTVINRAVIGLRSKKLGQLDNVITNVTVFLVVVFNSTVISVVPVTTLIKMVFVMTLGAFG